MRIVRLIPYFTDAFGGPPHHIKMLTRELAKKGHETVIYTTNLADRSGKTITFEGSGFEVRAFPAHVLVGDYFYTPEMRRALEGEEFDIVHAHCYRNYQTDIANRIAKERRKPLFFTAHGTLVKLPNLRDRILKGLYDVRNQGRLLKDASCVVALSHEEANQYHALGVLRGKIAVIYHGIDGEIFRPLPDPVELRRQWDLDGGPVVLYVGRLHYRKGVQYLLPAFQRLLVHFPTAHLVLCGSDYGFQKHLEQQTRHLHIQDHVVFTGAVERGRMPQVYALADVVVLPAQYEVFGHTIAEAAACGKPVVATKWGWASEFFESDTECLLVDRYGDVDELAQAIETLLGDPKRRADVGSRAREKVLRGLSWETCARKHLEMYNRALANTIPVEVPVTTAA
jgi:glycosyltransferase involved in cell wall biosynthesis